MKTNTKKPKKTQKELDRLAAIYKAIVNNDLLTIKNVPITELAAVKLTNYEYNALHLAITYGAKDIINYICSNKDLKDLITTKDINGDTPFHTAIFSGNFDGYVSIRESGVINANNIENKNPLEVIHEPERWRGFLEKVADKYHDQNAIQILNTIDNNKELVLHGSQSYDKFTSKSEHYEQVFIESKRNLKEVHKSYYTGPEDVMTEKIESPSIKINSSLTESGIGATFHKGLTPNKFHMPLVIESPANIKINSSLSESSGASIKKRYSSPSKKVYNS